jgi:hypothetical protein
LHVLVEEAGYPPELAKKLAHSDVDLHQAVELVQSGCTHETAADILLWQKRHVPYVSSAASHSAGSYELLDTLTINVL